MSKQEYTREPPTLKSRFTLSLTTGLIFMGIVMLALPISQLITEFSERQTTDVDTVDLEPPEMIEEPPPPPEEEQDEDIDDLEQDREPPTLEQLELSMSTDVSGFASSDFTMPSFSVGDELDEMIYELEDLTRAPRPTYRPSPTYPPELKRAGISGRVVLQFVVRDDGTVSNVKVERSDNPAFEEPAIRAVRKWRFEPGQKDGKAVNARVRLPIPFQVRK